MRKKRDNSHHIVKKRESGKRVLPRCDRPRLGVLCLPPTAPLKLGSTSDDARHSADWWRRKITRPSERQMRERERGITSQPPARLIYVTLSWMVQQHDALLYVYSIYMVTVLLLYPSGCPLYYTHESWYRLYFPLGRTLSSPKCP